MDSQEQLITNLWSQVDGREQYSLVVVDFFPKPVTPILTQSSQLVYNINFLQAKLNMPQVTHRPKDGLLEYAKIHNLADTPSEQNDTITHLSISLHYPTTMDWEIINACPGQIRFHFDRAPLVNILSDKVIIIDPGHGGQDYGSVGPTHLQEKYVTLEIAQRTKQLLDNYGAKTKLLRNKDIALSLAERKRQLASYSPDLVISLHTGNHLTGQVIGPKTIVSPRAGSKQGKKLAERMENRLSSELNFPYGGIGTNNSSLLTIHPDRSLWVEVCNITSRLEEGWLRDDGFITNTARSLTNGITDILAENS